MNVGKMLFYDIITGDVLVDTGEWTNAARKKTIAEQIATYPILASRAKSSFDVLTLEYGTYKQDFRAATSYRVNPATKRLEFTYASPSMPEVVTPPVPPLSESVKALADENADLLMRSAMQEVAITALQDENAELMMRLAMLEMGGSANV